VFAAAIFVFLIPAAAIPGEADWIQLGYVFNSVTKVGVLAGLCALGAANLRRFSALVALTIVGLFLSVGASAGLLILADTSAQLELAGVEIPMRTVLWGVVVVDGGIGLLLLALYVSARRARYQLRYLTPAGFEALAALAEAALPETDRKLRPEQVAYNVDSYMAGFRARRKWVVKLGLVGLWLYPLLFLKAPFPLLAAEERLRFAKKRFGEELSAPRARFLRRLVRAMIRLSQQMVFLGYYGDERTFESVGYAPFSKRPRYEEAKPLLERDRRPLDCLRPEQVDGDRLAADAVVVGSGAAGAIIAYRLAEAGRNVLVLERGLHLDPSEFSEDEVAQISSLYADGALQLSRDFSFQVLQGMCVGGSTVVNNAVCFDLPDKTLRRWNDELGAGLDEERLSSSFKEVRSWLRIGRPPSRHLQGGSAKFLDGLEKLGLAGGSGDVDVVEANISDCPGSGYCNIGCPFGSKLSMLDLVLPEGQERFGERLRILPECRAERIEYDGRRATGVRAELSDGRKLVVKADTVVVAAGTIASSWLLMESRIARGRAGKHICFNLASPVTADFDEQLDSFDGVQISHYYDPPQGQGFVMESWFNPVVSQALNMPGWFEDHAHNMRRFRNLTAAGVLVGTQRNARLARALTGGADIVYTPAREDLEKLVEGLQLLCRIYLAAGALRVMPSTLQFHEFRSEKDVELLGYYVRNNRDLSIGTGHPQGGNAISRDSGKGVVDGSCRVHGFDNLFVCDASVFPSSTTVNPQLTVMALANYAAPAMVAA
jgi:choline dehydrogenase-like flavoprotein